MSAVSLATGGGGRESARWGIAFVIICALHLGAAALLWRAHIFVPPATDIPPDTVLIDLEPASPPAVAAPAPPPPQPPPEPEVRKEEPPPPPVKAEVTLPKPPPPKPVPPRREKVVEPAPQLLPAPVAAVPHPDMTPRSPAPAEHTPAVDPMLTWEHRLLGRLQGFLQYPRWALLRRQDGVAYVRVTVDRNGSLISAELQRSSGIPLLDDEAVAVIQRAKPLPPPPPEVPGDPIVRVVPVRFILR